LSQLFLYIHITKLNIMITSNCCGAVAEVTSEDIGICPECYEHCVFEDDEDDE